MSPILQSIANGSARGYGAFFGAAAATSFESIATVTVGSGGAANIQFTSIPSTFTHLQVRAIARTTDSQPDGNSFRVRLNSDTANNYTEHRIIGTGSAVSAGGAANTQMAGYQVTSASQLSNTFGSFVMDILDYKDTNKNKTMRGLGGFEDNSIGRVGFWSSVWMSTSAITTLLIQPNGGNWAQYSHFALYGCKSA